jgi:hypothetical protein
MASGSNTSTANEKQVRSFQCEIENALNEPNGFAEKLENGHRSVGITEREFMIQALEFQRVLMCFVCLEVGTSVLEDFKLQRALRDEWRPFEGFKSLDSCKLHCFVRSSCRTHLLRINKFERN